MKIAFKKKILALYAIVSIKEIILLINLNQFASTWASITKIAFKKKILALHAIVFIEKITLLINLN